MRRSWLALLVLAGAAPLDAAAWTLDAGARIVQGWVRTTGSTGVFTVSS